MLVLLNHSLNRAATSLRAQPPIASNCQPPEPRMFFKKEKTTDQPVQGRPVIFGGASGRMICCKGIAGEGNEVITTSHPKLASFGYIATLKIESPSEESGVLVHALICSTARTSFAGHAKAALCRIGPRETLAQIS